MDDWEGTTYEHEWDLSLYDAPVKYHIYTYLSQGSTTGAYPINERVLSDGTIVQYADGQVAEFYTPNETTCVDYTEPCFDLNNTLP